VETDTIPTLLLHVKYHFLLKVIVTPWHWIFLGQFNIIDRKKMPWFL